MVDAKAFYDMQYRGQEYALAQTADSHSCADIVRSFVEAHDLMHKRCLEIGCGRGAFQDMVEDYTGLDYSGEVATYLHKPFFQGLATDLPFADSEFDGAWSIQVLEHVPDPEKALLEMLRVLRPGGVLLLAPAWQCRPWAADGYPVRPFSDFGWKGKLIKASIPIRNSIAFRALYIFPARLFAAISYLLRRRPVGFRYRKLSPNYEKFWMSDSDAVNSMDPYRVILWFLSRGVECVSHGRFLRQFFVRTGALVFRIRK